MEASEAQQLVVMVEVAAGQLVAVVELFYVVIVPFAKKNRFKISSI